MGKSKNLFFGEESREKLLDGITELAQAVKITMGPEGRTVVIESPVHTNQLTVSKDGVTVAKAVESLYDSINFPAENLGIRIMVQAAKNTVNSASDGTTTSIVLAEALIKNAQKLIPKDGSVTDITRHLKSEVDKVVSSLKKRSVKVSQKKILDIATISANNDKKVGKIISDAYKEVGKDGLITVDDSKTEETYIESTHGLKIDRGMDSRHYINNHNTDECIFEDCYILVSDVPINQVSDIEIILKRIIPEKKKLLIIAPLSKRMIGAVSMNVERGVAELCSIIPPNMGYKKEELMKDIALSVGATYFSESTGDDLSQLTFEDLGHAKKVVVGLDSTSIVRDEGFNEEVALRVEELKLAAKREKIKHKREFINRRIASLNGGIGVIYVGGQTDLEQKELRDRVEDSVGAVRSAIEEGILPGGGVALAKESFELNKLANKSIAQEILIQSFLEPMSQICRNAHMAYDMYNVEGFDKSYNYGFDIKNKQWGDMIDMGVIDPTKVTRSALENAVSVAITVLSTDAVITMNK